MYSQAVRLYQGDWNRESDLASDFSFNMRDAKSVSMCMLKNEAGCIKMTYVTGSGI